MAENDRQRRQRLAYEKNKSDSAREQKIDRILEAPHPRESGVSDMSLFDKKAGFTDPRGQQYLKESAGRGLGNAAGSPFDFTNMFINAPLQAGYDIFTGHPENAPVLPSVGQAVRNWWAGDKDIVPEEEVTPGVKLAGAGAELATEVAADPLNLLGLGALKKAGTAAKATGKPLVERYPKLASEAQRPPETAPAARYDPLEGYSEPDEKAAASYRGGKKVVPGGRNKLPPEKGSVDLFSVRKPEKGDLAQIVEGSKNKGGIARQEAAAEKMDKPLATPYIASADDKAMVQKIFQHANEQRSPNYPFAKDPIFGPADPELTKQLVPQKSISDILPPKPTGESPLPKNDRARVILENEGEIGQQLARWLKADPNDPLPFYSTGTVIQGLVEKGGLSMPEALQFMKRWAGQGAATSPRTATPQNLRNAGYLLYRNAAGDRLTKERQFAERATGEHGFPKSHNEMPFDKKGRPVTANLNRPGYAMMGMHTQLGDEFFKGTVDPWHHPKPFTFAENWSGNMADVTADTHNIRAILDAYDTLDPGGLPRGWFKSDMAYDNYKQGGGFPDEGQLDVGAIEDGLKGQTLGGRQAQTEYPIMQGPSYRAAEELGISPAEVQERTWFTRGPRTGLQSPRMAIPDLFNSQIETTAKVLGISQEEVLKLFAKHRIPLAEADVSDVPGYSMTG